MVENRLFPGSEESAFPVHAERFEKIRNRYGSLRSSRVPSSAGDAGMSGLSFALAFPDDL